MNIRKTVRYVAGVALLAAALGGIAPISPANAAKAPVAATATARDDVATQGWGDCTPQSYRMCTFAANDFNGATAYHLWSNGGSGWTYDLSWRADINDKISSIANNSSEYWCYFEHANFGGARLEVAPYAQVPNLDWQYMNDRISSWRPGRC